MLKIAVYGNCQAEAIQKMFLRFPEKFAVVAIRPVHLLDRGRPEEVISKIRDVDYFFYQPDSGGYGDLASGRIIENLCKYSTSISFPSVYFDAFHSRQMYLRDPRGARILSPVGDYHDKLIVESFLDGSSCASTIAKLDSVRLSESDCVENLDRALKYFSIREQFLDVKLSNFIGDCYFRKMLFYTFNHPSDVVLTKIFFDLLRLSGQNVPSGGVVSGNGKDFLSNYHFKSDQVDPDVFDFPGFSAYRSNSDILTTKQVVESYFSGYSSFGSDNLRVAYEYSLRRRLQVLGNQLVE